MHAAGDGTRMPVTVKCGTTHIRAHMQVMAFVVAADYRPTKAESLTLSVTDR